MDDAPPESPDAPDGPGLGLEPPKTSVGYQVLARKYRPATFEDLIGQDAMVRTLTNAFAADRIAHAYMLTGVRGVGKTTTARLIARALNFRSPELNAPSVGLDPPGEHCAAIMRSAHVDVMEMDAASHTGVGDIREILEGVRYAPVSARYKVYIIDEVHMLSSSAFNALLKTLEEPPPHVKFIFATTEIRKVPVTVLSRCQRFDLKRVDRDVLTAHLKRICGLEGAAVEDDGLALIARAAEGSVRDALSLLDQAMVQGGSSGSPVTALQVRDMLGLADRARVLDLLEAALKGDTAKALDEIGDLYDAGADPAVIVRDVLDYVHALSRLKAAPDADLGEAKETIARMAGLAEAITLGQLTRLWKLLLSGLDDVRQAPDPLAAAEMALLRLAAAAALPPPEDAARLMAGLAPGTEPASARAPVAPADAPSSGASEPAPVNETDIPAESGPSEDAVDDEAPYGETSEGPETLEALVELIAARRDAKLKYDVERFVRPVAFKPGRITFEPAPGAPPELAQRLSKRLKEWTGTMWAVLADPDARGGETLAERHRRERRETLESAALDPAVAEALKLFPGAELIDVRPAGEGDADMDEAPAEQRR